MDCPPCNGSGHFRPNPREYHVCPVCGGKQTLPDDPIRTVVCTDCQAAGVIEGDGVHAFNRKICRKCHGRGKLPRIETADAIVEGPFYFHVDAGTPRLAHLKLEALFNGLSGPIAIYDPYYGSGSLARLDLLQHCGPIRFLTSKPDSAEKLTIERKLEEWKQQHGAIEFRKSQKDDVHDRYVLAKDDLIILGHGLKDIGQKDSFVIQLRRDMAADLLDSVGASFETKWRNGTSIV